MQRRRQRVGDGRAQHRGPVGRSPCRCHRAQHRALCAEHQALKSFSLARCAAASVANRVSPVSGLTATKYNHGPGVGRAAAVIEALPGLPIGPGRQAGHEVGVVGALRGALGVTGGHPAAALHHVVHRGVHLQLRLPGQAVVDHPRDLAAVGVAPRLRLHDAGDGEHPLGVRPGRHRRRAAGRASWRPWSAAGWWRRRPPRTRTSPGRGIPRRCPWPHAGRPSAAGFFSAAWYSASGRPVPLDSALMHLGLPQALADGHPRHGAVGRVEQHVQRRGRAHPGAQGVGPRLDGAGLRVVGRDVREGLGGLDHPGLLQGHPDGPPGVTGVHHHGRSARPGAGPVLALGQPGHHGLQDLYGGDAGTADERDAEQQHEQPAGAPASPTPAPLLRGQRTAWTARPPGAATAAVPVVPDRPPGSAPRPPVPPPAAPKHLTRRRRRHRPPRRRRRWSSRGAGPSSVLAPCPVPGFTGPAGSAAPAGLHVLAGSHAVAEPHGLAGRRPGAALAIQGCLEDEHCCRLVHHGALLAAGDTTVPQRP